MEKYDSYKDSGVEWIGVIPSHWELVKLKYNLRSEKYACKTGPFGTQLKGEDLQTEGDVRVYNQRNVIDNNFETVNFYVTNQKAKSLDSFYTQPNDLLVTSRGTIGRSSILPNNVPMGILHPCLIALRIDESKCLTEWLKLFINESDAFSTNIFLNSNATTIEVIYTDTIKNVDITIPPVLEQHKLLKYLDNKCSKIDNVIATQEKRVELLRELKQSIITRAVTRGINPNAKLKDSGVEWIGEIPEHWEIKKIKYIKSSEPNAFVDGPFGSNLKSQHFVQDGDVYVIESGMITTGRFVFKDFKTITKEHFATIQRSECKANDIIIAKIGMNYGMAGELPYLDKPSVVSGNSLKITLDNNKVLNPIFVYLMEVVKKNGGYIGLVQETAQPALSLSGLNNFGLPIAPIEEQQQIINYIEQQTNKLDSSITKTLRQIELLKEYKQSLITEVVTGKRKVC